MKHAVRAAVIFCGLVFMPLLGGCDWIQDGIYRSGIEKAIHEDSLAGHAATADHIQSMRRVDLSDCPQDFREAYSKHIHAWEEAAQVQQAKADLAKDEDAAAAAGVLATLFGTDDTPWSDHEAAVQRVDQYQQKASEDIHSTWQEVEDVARKYGVQI